MSARTNRESDYLSTDFLRQATRDYFLAMSLECSAIMQ